MIWLTISRFLLANIWRTVALALILAVGVQGVLRVAQHATIVALKADLKAEKADLKAEKAERVVDAAIWQAKFASVAAQLADAKIQGEAAVAAKKLSDAEAAKKLAAERKKWKDLYDRDPAAKAWADAPLPPAVLDRLRR